MKQRAPCLTQGDCLTLLAEIEKSVERIQSAPPGSNARDNALIRKGKLHAYDYVKSRIVSLMRWKGMDA